MDIEDQLMRAIKMTKGLFPEKEEDPVVPAHATREDLWARILDLERKPTKKPRVEDAIRILVEDRRLTNLTYKQLAEVVREVFKLRGFYVSTSESSIRWYLSQRHDWKIQRRTNENIVEQL